MSWSEKRVGNVDGNLLDGYSRTMLAGAVAPQKPVGWR